MLCGKEEMVMRVKNPGKKLKNRNNWFDYLNILTMCLFCMLVIFPFWDMLVRSLSTARGSVSLSFMMWPDKINFESYQYVLQDSKTLSAYSVTIARTVLGTLVSLVLQVMLAYPLAKKDLPLRNVLTTILLIPMFFSGGMIPKYILNRQLGLVNNFLVYIIPSAVSVYNVIMIRNFLMSLDKSLEESALIDGAGYWTILFRIVVPLSKPILATVALWVAVAHWNAWFDSLIYAREPNLITMQLMLRRLLTTSTEAAGEMQQYMEQMEFENMTSNSVRMAATIITILPIMFVYPFVQKYFVKGIMVGSLKG